MRHHLFFSLVTASMLANQASASTIGFVEKSKNWAWVGSVSAGPVWACDGAMRAFYLTPEIEKSYVANRPTKSLFDGEVFLGVQKTLSQTLQGQLELTVTATSNTNLNDVGFNDAHGFHSTPTIVEAIPAPDFASHIQTAFTYTVGAGV